MNEHLIIRDHRWLQETGVSIDEVYVNDTYIFNDKLVQVVGIGKNYVHIIVITNNTSGIMTDVKYLKGEL